jgi:hypothetical protein
MAQYPNNAATDADLYVAVNNKNTTLVGALTASGGNYSGTEIEVADTTGFPSTGLITIDLEVISYTGVATSPHRFTGITRGQDGTTAASHASSSFVYHRVVAAHHNVLKEEVKAIETGLLSGLTHPLSVTSNTTPQLTVGYGSPAPQFKVEINHNGIINAKNAGGGNLTLQNDSVTGMYINNSGKILAGYANFSSRTINSSASNNQYTSYVANQATSLGGIQLIGTWNRGTGAGSETLRIRKQSNQVFTLIITWCGRSGNSTRGGVTTLSFGSFTTNTAPHLAHLGNGTPSRTEIDSDGSGLDGNEWQVAFDVDANLSLQVFLIISTGSEPELQIKL